MEENAATMSADFTLTEENMAALTDMDQVRNATRRHLILFGLFSKHLFNSALEV